MYLDWNKLFILAGQGMKNRFFKHAGGWIK